MKILKFFGNQPRHIIWLGHRSIPALSLFHEFLSWKTWWILLENGLYQFHETKNICRIVSLIFSNEDAVCSRINLWDDPMRPSWWTWWMHERVGFGSIWLTTVHLDFSQNTDFWYFKMQDGQNSQPGWITRQVQSHFK